MEPSHRIGSTVLGTDNVSGIVEILEGIRSIQESKTDCRDIEVLFTIAEELYTKGSKCLDFSKVCSRKAFVFDLDETVGIAARKAASLISFEIEVHGHATHAASEPETAEIVKDYKKACNALGLPGQLIRAFGGSDNNTFARHGIEGLLVSTGMRSAHATNESCTVEDLIKGANLAAELLTHG